MNEERKQTGTRTDTGKAGVVIPSIPSPPPDEELERLRGDMAARGEGAVPVEDAVPVVEVPEDAEREEDAEEGEPVEAVPFPEGIVGETAQWILDRCEKPFPPFAVVSSLAVWATLTGRKVRYQNQGTVLYAMIVAASSNGKDSPLGLARRVLGEMGVSALHFAGRLSSWNAGVEKLMGCWFHPAMLSLVDEAAGYFGNAAGADFGLLDLLKAAWSRAEGTLDPQGRVKKSGAVNLAEIHRPSLSMLLAAQPSTLGAAVGTAQLEDGLLPRALWVVRERFVEELEEANLDRSRALADSEEGLRILDRGKRLWNWLRDGDADFWDMAKLESCPNPKVGESQAAEDEDGEGGGVRREVWEKGVVFEAEPGAVERFRDFMRRTQARIRPAAEGQDGPMGYLWGKAVENAKRVALILAAARCGETAGPYMIRESEAAWAVRFVEATVYSGVRWARENMADSPFQKRVQRVAAMIRGAPGMTATRRNLTRTLQRWSTKEIDEALQTLLSSGQVEAVTVRTKEKGRSGAGYRWTGSAGGGR